MEHKTSIDFRRMPAPVRGLFNQLCEHGGVTVTINVSKVQMDNAFQELASYAARLKRHIPPESKACQEILKIATCVQLARQLKSVVPSKAQMRHQANECARMLSRQAKLLQGSSWTVASAAPHFNGKPGRIFDFVVECSRAAEAFDKLARSTQFRQKGRPSHQFDEKVLLLLMCRDLLTRYGGLPPGLAKGTAKPSPLVRFAHAIFEMVAEGETPSFSRIIESLKKHRRDILQVHGNESNPIVAAIKILMMAS